MDKLLNDLYRFWKFYSIEDCELLYEEDNKERFRLFLENNAKSYPKKAKEFNSNFLKYSGKKGVLLNWKNNPQAQSSLPYLINGQTTSSDKVFSEFAYRKLNEPDNTFLLVVFGGNDQDINMSINGQPIILEVKRLNVLNVYNWHNNGNHRPKRNFVPNPKHGQFGNPPAHWDNIRHEYVCTLYGSHQDASSKLDFAIGAFNNLMIWDSQYQHFMVYKTNHTKSNDNYLHRDYHSYHIEDITKPFQREGINWLDMKKNLELIWPNAKFK